MGRYRNIGVSTYNEGWFLRLSRPAPCAQYAYLYLTTGPATCIIPGIVYNLGPAGLAEMMRWPLEGFLEAFREGQEQGIFEADFEARLIFISRALEYNKPQSPNVVKGWEHTWSEIPICPLKNVIWQRLKELMEGSGKAFHEAFAKACPEPSQKPCPNKEKEKEQDQEQEKKDSAPVGASATGVAASLVSVWNEFCGPDLPKVKQLTQGRTDKIQTRLKDKPSFEQEFKEAVNRAAVTPFLCGQNERGWKADFDWMIANDTRVVAVLEGKYDSKSKGDSGSKKKPSNSGAFHSGDDSRFDRPADFTV